MAPLWYCFRKTFTKAVPRHRTPRRFAILVAALLAMCVAVRAQSPSPTPKNPEEVSTGSISGKVVNENGQPLVGANLFVRGTSNFAGGRSTTSDVEGNFRVSGLDPGLYTVSANAPAYTTDPAPPTFYRLGDTVRLELIRGGVITGTVTNSLGEPVIGVRVRAMRIRDTKGQAQKLSGFAVNERTTDDRGVYRIYGLTPGTYLVSAGGGGGFTSGFNPYDSDVPTYSPSSTRDTAAEVSVRAGEEITADVRYRGESGYTVSGSVNVSGTNGSTVALMPVSSGGAVASSFQVPGIRGFAFNGLADGEYKLVAQELNSMQTAGVMPLMAVSDVKLVTVKGANVIGIELTPKPLASVAGRIALERSKAPECQGKRPPLFAETLVQAQKHEKDSEDDDPIYMRIASSSATVDENGAFVLRNLRPGRFRFEPRFYARYWYLQSIAMNTAATKPQKIDAAASWTAVKSGDQLTALTITLAEGAASLRGRLALAEGAAAPAGMVVYLIPAEPDKADDVLRFFVTDIASDGTFTLNNLAPGKYLAFTQTNVDAQIATLTKLRQPESAAARTKLRRSAETQKTEIELKPCQNLADYQLKQ